MINIPISDIPQLAGYLPMIDKGEQAFLFQNNKKYEIKLIQEDEDYPSTASLAGAYSDDEPDYSKAHALEENAKFSYKYTT